MDPNINPKLCLLITLSLSILATSVKGGKIFQIDLDQFHTCIPIAVRPPYTATVPSQTLQISGETFPATRHHIIPFNILRQFINIVLSENPFGSEFGAYLAIQVSEVYRQFVENDTAGAHLPFDGPPRRDPDVLFLSGDPPRTFGDRPQSFEADHRMLSAFTWMPANLFYGPPPSRRTDDPRENFETGAIAIVGGETYLILERAYRNMRNFINNYDQRTATNYDMIMADLNQLSSDRSTPYEFNPDQWEVSGTNGRGQKKFAIKQSSVTIVELTTTTPKTELRKRSIDTDDDDEYIHAVETVCDEIVHHLKPQFNKTYTGVNIDYDVEPLFVYSTKNNRRHFVYGQNAKTLHWFIKRVDDWGRVGEVTAEGSWQNYYAVQVHFEINGIHYFYGHNLKTRYWFIQILNADGTMGRETANGRFAYNYKTMFHVNINGEHYLYGQNERQKIWFLQLLKPDGTLGPEVSHGTWNNFYDIQFPFKVGDDVYIAGFNSQSRKHYIRDINANNLHSMGRENVWTTLDHSYSVLFPFSLAGKTYLYGHDSNSEHYFYRQVFSYEMREGSVIYKFTDARPFNINGYQYFYAKVKGSSRWSLFHFDLIYV